MPIRDILGACPACGGTAEFRSSRWRGESCGGCGARFRRAGGAAIEMTTSDTRRVVKPAVEWAADAAAARLAAPTPERSAPAILRRRVRQDPIRSAGEYLNRVDRFGRREPGELSLRIDHLEFRTATGSHERWLLREVAALGSSSGMLQLRMSDSRVLAIGFPTDSLRLWEEAIRSALQAHYHDTGRGEILEFQPRIVTG